VLVDLDGSDNGAADTNGLRASVQLSTSCSEIAKDANPLETLRYRESVLCVALATRDAEPGAAEAIACHIIASAALAPRQDASNEVIVGARCMFGMAQPIQEEARVDQRATDLAGNAGIACSLVTPDELEERLHRFLEVSARSQLVTPSEERCRDALLEDHFWRGREAGDNLFVRALGVVRATALAQPDCRVGECRGDVHPEGELVRVSEPCDDLLVPSQLVF
jgi:hypothetical protein